MSIVKSKIRTIPDYPKQGVMFRDITSLLIDPEGFRLTIAMFVERYQDEKIQKIAAIEARGFITGSALAFQLGVGFVPIRKKGKLPGPRIAQTYALEYGEDQVEIHLDAVQAGEKILIMDDLIATGGTLEASILLIQRLKGVIHECATIIDLPDLGGAKRIKEKYDINTYSICAFEGH